MNRHIRLTLAAAVLLISVFLLGWAFWPQTRLTRQQLLQPTQMQVPTPGSFLPVDTLFALAFPPHFDSRVTFF